MGKFLIGVGATAFVITTLMVIICCINASDDDLDDYINANLSF